MTLGRASARAAALVVLVAGAASMARAADKPVDQSAGQPGGQLSTQPAGKAARPLDIAMPDRPTTVTLALDKLLADPVPAQAPFKLLRDRRRWLAHQAGDPAKFEQVADEFAKKGAYYSAIEILWFADKLTDNQARRDAFKQAMLQWKAKTQAQGKPVDAALQLWAAGKPDKAIEQLRQVMFEQPYNEVAHYQNGHRAWLSYTMHDSDKLGALPIGTRARLFREVYVSCLLTLEIDPLYNDAYYQLSLAREMLGDSPPFLRRTQPISERAMTFMTIAVKAIGKIDDGDRSAGALAAAGDALAEAEVYPYAAYAYQAAIAQAKDQADLKAAVSAKLAALLKDKIPMPSAQ
jgi:hypothetical protein